MKPERSVSSWGAAALVTTVAVVAAQSGQPSDAVSILAPIEGSYLAGPTRLFAHVEPVDDVERVVFFVDGRQICVLSMPPFACQWDAGSAVVEHQVRLVATFKGGGRVVRNTRTKGIAVAESVDVDVVQVTATVTDGHGHFVKGLPRSAFHVFEDGRLQKVSHFESEDVPLDLIVGLDISSSMTPGVAKLKEAATEFLTAVPARDRVTVLAFNDSIFTLTRSSTNLADRARAVERLAPWGETALYDVIIKGIEMLGRRGGRKALVVFTDGEDQGSHATIDDVERRLETSDATVYVIAQGRGMSLDALKKVMVRLAQPTGGRALFVSKLDELRPAFAELLEELSNQYLLGYPPPGNGRDKALHRIKVEVDGHYTVRARQSYRATASDK